MKANHSRFLVCLMAVSLLVACLAGCRQAPLSDHKVRIGVIKALGTVSPFLSEKLGYFAAEGLEVSVVEFNTGPALMEAFAAGNLDLAYGGLAPANTWRSQGIALKVVASCNDGGHLVIVHAGAGLSAPADLKGRTVAAPTAGSVTDTLLRGLLALELAGLDPAKDMTILPGIAPADMPAALFLTKQVQAIVTWEPFAAQALLQYPDARVLFSFPAWWKERYGSFYVTNVVSARQSFIDQRPEILKRMLRAHQQTQDFINQQPDKANSLIAAELNLPVAVIAKARESMSFGYDVDVAAGLRLLEFSKRLGYIKQIPTAGELFDLRFLGK
ncbi:MAG: ABC transporter substrate-binding protein [Bacillota bacterium]